MQFQNEFLTSQQSFNNNLFANKTDQVTQLGALELPLLRVDSYQYPQLMEKKPSFNPFDNFLQNGLVSQEYFTDFIQNEPQQQINYPANFEINQEQDVHEQEVSQLIQDQKTYEEQRNEDEFDFNQQGSRKNTAVPETHNFVTESSELTFEEDDLYYQKKESVRSARSGRSQILRSPQKKASVGFTKKIRKTKKKNSKAPKEDTKNLLRNFGNAQNKFAKDHKYAHALIDKKFSNLTGKEKEQKIREFRKWIPIKLENFKQFQNVWAEQGFFADVYRELCWEFYEKFAAHYIYSTSRMSEEVTRKTHQKYVYRFLEGIIDPSTFFFFKKTKN